MTFRARWSCCKTLVSFLRIALLRVAGQHGGSPVAATSLATLVALAVLLPPLYLVIRTADAGAAAWEAVTRARTLELLVDTVALASAVTIMAIVLALPLAWLTTRTDLPLRSAWTVLLTLPLVFPSYVAAFALVAALGPRGLLQDLLAPLGVETLPALYGFWGAWLVLTLITYPYVFLSLRAGLQGLDRSLEEAAQSLGKSAFISFLRVTLPSLATLDRRGRAPRGALHAQRLRRRLHPPLQLADERHLHPVQVILRPQLCRRPRSPARGGSAARRLRRSGDARPCRLSCAEPAAADPVAIGPLALARRRLLRPRGGAGGRPADGSHRLLGRPWPDQQRRRAAEHGRRVQLTFGVESRRLRSARGGAADRLPDGRAIRA